MNASFPIIDLHCDLLYYLAGMENRTAHDREARCSTLQLKEGGVVLQTLAIYTETKKGSVALASKQREIYENLFLKHPQEVRKLHSFDSPKEKNKIHFLASIENASGLCEEEEPIEKAFKRLKTFQESIGPILYVSLTWNDENRFGGGNKATGGIKPDGVALLEALSTMGIAIDLSHTSDKLAHDIFNHIDKKSLPIIPIASHSNFRQIVNEKRNLPEEFAQEIIKRGGVIGLNFVKKFIGSPVLEAFYSQIEYADKLGGLDALCLGADYFSEFDINLMHLLGNLAPFYHDGYDTSACYPKLFEHLSARLDKNTLEKIAHKNCLAFFERMRQKRGEG